MPSRKNYSLACWRYLNIKPHAREEEKEFAQKYLDKTIPRAAAGDPVEFYGYRTIPIEKDGKMYGMLSVNAMRGRSATITQTVDPFRASVRYLKPNGYGPRRPRILRMAL